LGFDNFHALPHGNMPLLRCYRSRPKVERSQIWLRRVKGSVHADLTPLTRT
jgi:hypothetical protein